MRTATATLYTPEDLLEMPDGQHFELIDGELVEKNMSAESSEFTLNLSSEMRQFIKNNPIGKCLESSCSYQCFPDDPGKVRRPDASFILKGRLGGSEYQKGHVQIAPDIAIETISPSNEYSPIQEKVDEFLEAGTRLIWVIEPSTRSISVHRADGSTSRLREGDVLSGEEILPDFRCPLKDIFFSA